MAFWDFLRPITQEAVYLDSATRILVFALAAFLFAVSILAYRRNKGTRLLFVTIAFFFIAAEWVLNVLDLYLSPGDFFNRAAGNIFELIALLSLFMAIFKK